MQANKKLGRTELFEGINAFGIYRRVKYDI